MAETTYEKWMRQEGLPIYRGHGITDVPGLELGDWERTGGRGAFLHLPGLEGLTGMYVGEIPPGGQLKPEKHLYDELIYILSGSGVTQVWSRGDEDKTFFEWQAGALFAPPLNTHHRLINTSGTEPVRFLGVTAAPLVMDLYHNVDFVMENDYRFPDRYDGRPSYFEVGPRKEVETKWGRTAIWETNFIPNVQSASLDPSGQFGRGNSATSYQMSGNVLCGHMAEWPVGLYRKAHHHGGGAILLIVRSRGYTVMWPGEAGVQPYASGHGDQVVRVDWEPGSVFSPPTGWFHQHFNTGAEPARQLALRYGSATYGVQFHDTQSMEGVGLSVSKGGTLIEYEEEDPEFRRIYKEELAANGVPYQMEESVGVGG